MESVFGHSYGAACKHLSALQGSIKRTNHLALKLRKKIRKERKKKKWTKSIVK